MDKYNLFLGCHQLRNDLFILKGLLGTTSSLKFSQFVDDHKKFFVDGADWDEETCNDAFLALRKDLIAECHETIEGSFVENSPIFMHSLKDHPKVERLYQMIRDKVDSAETGSLDLHSIIEYINEIERSMLYYIAAPNK